MSGNKGSSGGRRKKGHQQKVQSEDQIDPSKKETYENESSKLQDENVLLKKENKELKQKYTNLEKENCSLKAALREMEAELERKSLQSGVNMDIDHANSNASWDELETSSRTMEDGNDIHRSKARKSGTGSHYHDSNIQDREAMCSGGPEKTSNDGWGNADDAETSFDNRNPSNDPTYFSGGGSGQWKGKTKADSQYNQYSDSDKRRYRDYAGNSSDSRQYSDKNLNYKSTYVSGGGGQWKGKNKADFQCNQYSDSDKRSGAGRYTSGEKGGPSYDRQHKGRNQQENLDYSSRKLTFIEVDGDLFEAPKSSSLAHCVAEDLRMGSGIAVTFRQMFRRIDELLDQRSKVGEVAILDDDSRFIYYLITKKVSNGKPRFDDLKRSLYAMKKHCEENGVTEVAMPRIGCGLDRLDWEKVRFLLQDVFADLNMTITVYNFTEERASNERVPESTTHGKVQEKTSNKKASASSVRKVYIVEKNMNLVDIASETLLVYFGSVIGDVNPTIQKLDQKHSFITDYKSARKEIGGVVETWKKNELLVSLIVKENKSDILSFKVLKDCLVKVRNLFRVNNYFYMGLEAFKDPNDDMIMPKIITLLNDVFYGVKSEVWICWPPNLYNEQERVSSYQVRQQN